MALRFIDGFDHYVTADVGEKWSSPSGAPAISAGNGRRGTASCRMLVGSYWLAQTLDNQATWIIGCALRRAAHPLTAVPILAVVDVGTKQVDLRVNIVGTLSATRNGTVLGTTTYVLPINVFVYVEMRATIHASTGSVMVRINGMEVLNLSGQNTQATANAFANQIRIGQVDPSWDVGALDVDDVYICDSTGSAPHNDFLGDCRVDCLLPAADGANSAWTVSSGSQHSLLVDEAAPNDDTDYLSSSTASARDTHTMGNLSAMPTPTIYGVQHCLSAKKEDAGTCAIKNVLKSGATTQAGATSHALSTSYAYYREVWATDPNTSAAWTTAAIDAVEAGVEKV